MSKEDAKYALLFGSYISTSKFGSTSVVPEIITPDISKGDLRSAADELLSEGLVKFQDKYSDALTMDIDPLLCPYWITPKGESELGKLGPELHLKAELGLFKIIIAMGGSTVNYHEEQNQTSNIVTFEQNMIKHIEKSAGSDKVKQEAKSKLKEFLTHPLLSAVLGAVLGAALAP